MKVRIEITRKYKLAARRNCINRLLGAQFHKVYLEVDTLLEFGPLEWMELREENLTKIFEPL